MDQSPQEYTPIFHYDLGSENNEVNPAESTNPNQEMVELMRQLVLAQDRQNELMEEMVEQVNAAQRQRASELGQWKDANPLLAKRCRAASEALGQVQTEFIHNLTCDINDNFEGMLDGEFVLNEFVDKYGPRLAHLNGVLQLLSQLSEQTGSSGNQPF